MAIRVIRTNDDEVLRKKSKNVDAINDRILTLLDDMADTMYKAEGVGLAAPQIGVLRRLIVIDIGEGMLKLINPQIISYTGEQIDIEGCLSLPDTHGEVKRPESLIVRAMNDKGQNIEINASGLLARALNHEIDHLNGILFIDKAIRIVE